MTCCGCGSVCCHHMWTFFDTWCSLPRPIKSPQGRWWKVKMCLFHSRMCAGQLGRKSRVVPNLQSLKANDKCLYRTGYKPGQKHSLTLWEGITLFVCFSHVQREPCSQVLGDLTLCRWEEMIFKLPVCKLARKWQHCHCCFCSKHPIKLAVYTFLPDSCLPAEGSWAANEAQRRNPWGKGRRFPKICRLSPRWWQGCGRCGWARVGFFPALWWYGGASGWQLCHQAGGGQWAASTALGDRNKTTLSWPFLVHNVASFSLLDYFRMELISFFYTL